MVRKYIIRIIIVVIILLIAFKLFSNKKQLDEKNKPVVATAVRIPVKAGGVQEQLLDLSIKKTGTLAPFQEAKVLAASSGTIQYLKFKLGDRVKQGQVLAVMDSRLLQLDQQKAATNLSKLKNDLQTYTELYAGHAATEEKLNQTRQDYNDAVNQLNHAKKQLDDAGLKSPTNGIISVKDVEQGVFVNAGAEIATIVNVSEIKVQVNLTENEVYQVKQGQHVKITTEVYRGKVFNGTISFVSPQADATHSYAVEVMIDSDPQYVLHSGTFVYADFSKYTRQQVLVIPREALAESVQNASVYVVINNRARQKTVVTGREMGDFIEILSGLNKNDVVVLSGQINLKDGTPVSISK
ncbi:efflux RND transporter periplasmic adaptor subunit [Pedobacter sp. L105]|uniref:efflux RND transporter periplasmic adaptor subunit n=1 Tax=Pedobacter sp. L105 TaxID=1641871 RepID=UPI00131DCFD8|nr:efflux RND transporter periplasmic adaptor subunit [Pedobacter sp. L105]